MGFYEFILNNPVRIAISNFLNKELISTQYFLLNIWSFIHLSAGMLLIYILIKLKAKWRYLILLGLLIIWEIFEIIMASTTSLFIMESYLDIIWDLIFGFVGAGIIDLFFQIRKI